MELISNLSLIADKLFHLYQKRRKKAIERLLDTGTAKYIMNEYRDTSGRIKRYLINEEILTEDYELTSKGEGIRKKLIELSREIGE